MLNSQQGQDVTQERKNVVLGEKLGHFVVDESIGL